MLLAISQTDVQDAPLKGPAKKTKAGEPQNGYSFSDIAPTTGRVAKPESLN